MIASTVSLLSILCISCIVQGDKDKGISCKSYEEYECANAGYCFAEYDPEGIGKNSLYGCYTEGCLDVKISGENRTAKLCCCNDGDNCNNHWITAAPDMPKLKKTDIGIVAGFGTLLLLAFAAIIYGVNCDKHLRVPKDERPRSSGSHDNSVRTFLRKVIRDDDIMSRTPIVPLALIFFVFSLELIFTCLTEIFFWVPHSYKCCEGIDELKDENSREEIQCPQRRAFSFFLPFKLFQTFLKHLVWFLPFLNLCLLYSMYRYIRVSYLRKSDKGQMLLFGAGMNIVMSVLWAMAGGLNLWTVLSWISDREHKCKPIPSVWIAYCSFALICAILSLMEVGALFFLLYEKKKLSWSEKEHMRIKQRNKKLLNVFSNEKEGGDISQQEKLSSPSVLSSSEESDKQVPSPDSTDNSVGKIRSKKFHGVGRFKRRKKKKEVLAVEPPMIEFLSPGFKGSKIQRKNLTLKSLKKKRHLAFKVLTNQPFCYLVKPNCGFLAPGESQNILVEHQIRDPDEIPASARGGKRLLINYGQQQLLVICAVLPESADISMANRFEIWTEQGSVAVGPPERWIRLSVPIWFNPPGKSSSEIGTLELECTEKALTASVTARTDIIQQ